MHVAVVVLEKEPQNTLVGFQMFGQIEVTTAARLTGADGFYFRGSGPSFMRPSSSNRSASNVGWRANILCTSFSDTSRRLDASNSSISAFSSRGVGANTLLTTVGEPFSPILLTSLNAGLLAIPFAHRESQPRGIIAGSVAKRSSFVFSSIVTRQGSAVFQYLHTAFGAALDYDRARVEVSLDDPGYIREQLDAQSHRDSGADLGSVAIDGLLAGEDDVHCLCICNPPCLNQRTDHREMPLSTGDPVLSDRPHDFSKERFHDFMLQQPVAVLREHRVVPRVVLDRQSDEPAEQQVVAHLFHHHAFATHE
ncbi:hypothetical protein B0G81_7706 [Paraburkholderia sp. BL6665CI2N2]|nr:hypothetical protein B0G81_7706 [Paraburkholderia sp. BL6665CI2N2]